MDLSELKRKAHSLEPIVRIGKSGLSDSVIDEIKKHLRRKKLIKIKFLKSCLENNSRKEFANEIAQKTDSEIVQLVGCTLVLYKR